MLTYPGEYPQPLTRVTNVQVPTVGGFATARLQSVPELVQVGTDSTLYNTDVFIQNTGAQNTVVQLKEMDSYVSGPRVDLGTPMSLVPLGMLSQVVKPSSKYLEIWTTGTTESEIRVQLSGRIQWAQLGFAKTETTIYPPQLWQWDLPPLSELT